MASKNPRSFLVKNRRNLIERLQSLEYKVIAFTKKLFDEIKGFDEKNVTEDIEITWNLVSRGYKVEMSMMSRVLTVVPEKFKHWYKQRIRWNIGGIQTIKKYRHLFLTKGSLGSFILPFFIFSQRIWIF